jgi:hypothetical protein
MVKKHRPTTAEHIEIARHINAARAHLSRAHSLLQNHYGKTHKSAQALIRARDHAGKARHPLDADHHAVASDDDIKKYGYVYYGGEGGKPDCESLG